MVGDGLGDIKAFELAGLSIAVDPTHAEVAYAADFVIEGHSLLNIIDIFKRIENKSENTTGKDMRL